GYLTECRVFDCGAGPVAVLVVEPDHEERLGAALRELQIDLPVARDGRRFRFVLVAARRVVRRRHQADKRQERPGEKKSGYTNHEWSLLLKESGLRPFDAPLTLRTGARGHKNEVCNSVRMEPLHADARRSRSRMASQASVFGGRVTRMRSRFASSSSCRAA